jgi:hypothetical protein
MKNNKYTIRLKNMTRRLANHRWSQKAYHTARKFPRRTILASFLTVLLLVSLVLFVGRAHANSQGPLSASSTSDCADDAGTGTVTWTGAGNAFSSNNSYATASVDGTATHYITCTNYGFSIPTGSTINGIVVGVERKVGVSCNGGCNDAAMRVIKGGTIGSTDRSTATPYTTADAYEDHGSSSDLWGDTWAVSDINASNFGAAFAATKPSAAGSAQTVSVDHIRMTVYYTPPSTQYAQASYRLLNNKDATSTGTFTNKVDYTTGVGSSPRSVATADFNGDGKLDVAVASLGSNSVSVLINNGNGTFANKVDYTTATAPQSVATADFNGDGKPDIVAANLSSNSVSVFLNNGNGTFATKVDYTVGTSPYSVTAADFNADGKVDLATANGGSDNVSVLINNGTGTFATKVDYTTGTSSSPRAIIAADFNGDGKPDLAAADNSTTNTSVFINNGNGTFATKVDYTVGSNPVSVTAADFNADGKADLAVANSSTTLVSVLINNGNGTFATKVDYTVGSNPVSVTAADFNADSKPDLAIINSGDNTVSVLINNGTGTFATKVDYATATAPQSVTAADLNGDGKPDLAAVGSTSTSLSVLMDKSDPMDVNAPLAPQNTSATLSGDGQPFRLRMDIGITSGPLSTSMAAFKLQYATQSGGSCSATPSGNYTDVTDTSTVQYYQNTYGTNGAAITDTNNYGPTDGANNVILENYLGKGTTSFTNPVAVSAGQDGMWDFALTMYHSLQNTHYCMRIVQSDGTPLNTYTIYPEIIAPAASFSQASYRWYNPDPAGSSSTFIKSYGASGTESITDMTATSDGGFIATGSTTSGTSGTKDVILTKFSAGGGVVWTKTIDHGLDDVGNSVIQSSDGGYAVTGTYGGQTVSGTDYPDYMFLDKFDSNGSLSWEQTWGMVGTSCSSPCTKDSAGESVTQITDGSFVVVGSTYAFGAGQEDGLIVEYDSSGTLSWAKTWGNGSYDYVKKVVSTSDGGFAALANANVCSPYSTCMALLKYTSGGTLSWTKVYGSNGTGSVAPTDLIQTSSGGYAITGAFEYQDCSVQCFTNTDGFMAIYDSSGNQTGIHTVDFNFGSESGGNVVQTTDGGFAVTYAIGGKTVLVKYDSSGAQSWEEGLTGFSSTGTTLTKNGNGGYAVAGPTTTYVSGGGTDLLVANFDSSGGITNCPGTICASVSFTSDPSTVVSDSVTATLSPATGGTDQTGTTTASTVSFSTATVVAGFVGPGFPMAAQNKPLDLNSLNPISLRIAVAVNDSGIDVSSQNFKLQFAPLIGATSCSSLSNGSYSDVTTGTTLHYYDDGNYSDDQQIGTDIADPTDGSRTMVAQSYQESNDFSNGQVPIYAGQDGIWQFSLAINNPTLKGRDFCLRVALSSGTALTAANLPEVAYNAQMKALLRGGNWFNRSGIKQNLIL